VRRNYLIAIRTFRLAPMGNSADRSSQTFTRSSLWTKRAAKGDAFLWPPAELDADMASETSRGLANIKAIWGIWFDCDGGDLRPDEFAAMFPHLTMMMYNSASSTIDAPRWHAVIPTTCAMTIDVHRNILMQLMKSFNRRGDYSKKATGEASATRSRRQAARGSIRPSSQRALFYLPVQAAAGPPV
jgi:hypothetical protein